MEFNKISKEIQEAEGVLLGDDKTLYVREDEVMRLILKFAYNIEYNKLEDDNYEE